MLNYDFQVLPFNVILGSVSLASVVNASHQPAFFMRFPHSLLPFYQQCDVEEMKSSKAIFVACSRDGSHFAE